MSWWVSHSLGSDASTGSEGLRWRGIGGGTGTCASLRAGISGDRADETDEGGRAGVCEAKVGGTARRGQLPVVGAVLTRTYKRGGRVGEGGPLHLR